MHHPSSVTSRRSPNKWFTPTHLEFSPVDLTEKTVGASWQSRRERKGRYARKNLDVSSPHPDKSQQEKRFSVQARYTHDHVKLKPGWYVDISFWVAFTFTLGSMVWVVNGFLVWLPDLRPRLATVPFYDGSAATAFVGASIFEVGAYLGVVEAVVRGLEMKDTSMSELLHHHRRLQDRQVDPASQADLTNGEKPSVHKARRYLWFGPPLWHDLGYVAAIVQFFGATIFWISSLTGLPRVIPGLESGNGSLAIIDVFYWTPQVVGGMGFIMSSAILMYEVQTKWWRLAPGDIGWQVGFWNLIGAIGFTLCGALGYAHGSKTEYQSGLSTFWASWAFLIGSVVQLFEAIFREAPRGRDHD